MMKKRLALLLCLLLMFSSAALAESSRLISAPDATSSATPAAESGNEPTATPVAEVTVAPQTYTCDGLFSFIVPGGMWLDDTAYADDFELGQTWRFMLYDSTRAIDVTKVSALGRYEGQSLVSMTDEELADYRETFLDQNVGQNAEYLDSICSTDGSLRFMIFSVKDGSGLYYTAETLMNGAIYAFDCYRADITDAQESDLEALRAFLASLTLAAAQ